MSLKEVWASQELCLLVRSYCSPVFDQWYIQGAGNASIAMRSLWFASIANIILDPLLIYGIGSWAGWGLEGAAIATCIGRTLGVLYQCKVLWSGESAIKIRFNKLVPDPKLIWHLVEIAWPATFQFIIASGSWIVFTKLIAESGGTTASAAYQIAIRNVVFLSCQPGV